MSRNKDIELLHLVSKEPYSVCRRRMKKAHQNLTVALLGTDFFERIDEMKRIVNEAVNNLAEGLKPCIEHIKSACQTIIDAYLESKRCPYCDAELIRPWFEYDVCPYCKGEMLTDEEMEAMLKEEEDYDDA